MTDNLQRAGFVVYQSGFAIYGTGPTLEAAMIDAAEWLDGDEIDPDFGGSREVHGDFYYLPATAALIAEVQANGGQIAYATSNGIACTEAEDAAR